MNQQQEEKALYRTVAGIVYLDLALTVYLAAVGPV